MEQPIFDRNGRCVGWLEDDVIFDRSGRYRAFVENNEVFPYEGKYLGEFEDSYFWDRSGAAVAFLEDATNGPITPVTVMHDDTWMFIPAKHHHRQYQSTHLGI